MAKGKFEGGARQRSRSAAGRRQRRERKLWPILLAVVGALIVVGGALLLLSGALPLNLPTAADDDGLIAADVYAAGVNLGGMTREEAIAALEEAAPRYTADLTMTLVTSEQTAEDAALAPIALTFPAAETDVTLDAEKAWQEAYRVGRELGKPTTDEAYLVPAERYLSMDAGAIRDRLRETVDTLHAGSNVVENKLSTANDRREVSVRQEDGTTEKKMQDVQLLRIQLGTSAVDFREEALFDAVMQAYAAGNFNASFVYTRTLPAPVDVDALFEKYCKPGADAYYDTATHEIVKEVDGFGFDREELERQLETAQEGDIVEVELREIQPEVTAQKLEESLFSDTLAAVSTPHTVNYNRTRNLELACQAIDGTVVLPGDVFSFNDTVGIRTEAKGYLPATAYVSGGGTAEEIGGGVCQVASSIYYATLKADLKTVERTEHMFAVTYVPMGMDAAIYWGSLDFKFQNDTDYPLRIDASVSGGYVNISLMGTDERDYTVELISNTLSTNPFEEVEVETDEVEPGTVITTGYTGYRVSTYMIKYDKATGERLSEDLIAYSNYNRRDREVAVAPQEETEPTEWQYLDPDPWGTGMTNPPFPYYPTEPTEEQPAIPWIPPVEDPGEG